MKPAKKRSYVMIFSAVIATAVALWGIFAHESFAGVADSLMGVLKKNGSWLYLWGMLLFVIFSLVLAFSRWGKVRLGADDEKPEYSTVSWFAMLFAAGMGVGLVFWGVAEPLSHYVAPMAGIDPASEESAAFAVRSCFMHWGLHPWACYAVMGLGLAYFQFRKGKAAMVSNILTPLWGERPWLSAGVDIFTAVLTAIGVAVSFGMGCLQISEGLNHLFGIPNGAVTWVVIIVLICCVYMWSSISGVSRGIKFLSNLNLGMFLALMLLAFVIGPMGQTLQMGVKGLGDYLLNFFPDSVNTDSGNGSTWVQDWRVFYWAWWVSWAPFVGSFVARISRGRTIREFVLGVIIVPMLVSVLWFTVFSGMTLNVMDQFSFDQLLAMSGTPETTLFLIFERYPFGKGLSVIAMVLLITFFITSADSATFVLSMLTSEGTLNPPTGKKLFWGALIAVTAFALLLSGGIQMIQTISIVIAFPYLFILALIGVSLVHSLRKERK